MFKKIFRHHIWTCSKSYLSLIYFFKIHSKIFAKYLLQTQTMTTTTVSPQLQAMKAETDNTGVGSSENLNMRKLTTESSPLKKGDSDPESLQVSVVKQTTTLRADGFPEVEMTPAQLRKFKLDGIRVIIGGALMHLVRIFSLLSININL